jgi:hypothetical protein
MVYFDSVDVLVPMLSVLIISKSTKGKDSDRVGVSMNTDVSISTLTPTLHVPNLDC